MTEMFEGSWTTQEHLRYVQKISHEVKLNKNVLSNQNIEIEINLSSFQSFFV